MSSYRYLEVKLSGPVARVTLNRPEVRNALNRELLEELVQVMQEISGQESLRVVVLTGSGGVFCAGADLREFNTPEKASADTLARWGNSLGAALDALEGCPLPVVVKVNGPVYGGGLGLVAAGDLAVAAQEVRFSFPEVRLGVVPALIAQPVMKRLGYSRSRRLMLTGETFSAEQARDWGLVAEVAPQHSLEDKVEEIVNNLLKGAPGALKKCKELLTYTHTHPPAENRKFAVQAFVETFGSREAREGRSAFREKRAPDWKSTLENKDLS